MRPWCPQLSPPVRVALPFSSPPQRNCKWAGPKRSLPPNPHSSSVLQLLPEQRPNHGQAESCKNATATNKLYIIQWCLDIWSCRMLETHYVLHLYGNREEKQSIGSLLFFGKYTITARRPVGQKHVTYARRGHFSLSPVLCRVFHSKRLNAIALFVQCLVIVVSKLRGDARFCPDFPELAAS